MRKVGRAGMDLKYVCQSGGGVDALALRHKDVRNGVDRGFRWEKLFIIQDASKHPTITEE